MEKAFDCRMCGVCCKGEGGITVHSDEIERIAAYLKVEKRVFVTEYCYEKNGKFYINVNSNMECVLFDDVRGCRIQSVKPSVCYQWPFYTANMESVENWRMAQDACPGIAPASSYEEFLKQGQMELEAYLYKGWWR